MSGLTLNTKLYLPFDENTLGATTINGAREIFNYGSATSAIVEQRGNASLSTAQTKYGKSSLYLNRSLTGRLIVPRDNGQQLFADATQDYTMDLWVKHDNYTGYESYHNSYDSTGGVRRLILVHGGSGAGNQGIGFGGDPGPYRIFSGAAGRISDTNWHHVAVCKDARNGPVTVVWGVYLDGVQIIYHSYATEWTSNVDLKIGTSYWSGLTNFFSGHMAHNRFQSSNIFNATPNAGLTDTITPPASAADYVVDANTSLYLPMETQDQSGDGGSNAYHIPDASGTANLSTSITKYASDTTSLALDGNSGYVVIPDSADWDFFTSLDSIYTIDCWIRSDSDLAEQTIFEHGSAENHYVRMFYNADGDDKLYFRYKDGTETVHMEMISSTTLAKNTWYHVCVVMIGNGSQWTCGMYIDGIQEAYDTPSDTVSSYVGNFLIGERSFSATKAYWDGNIAHLRIQASNIFNAAPAGGLTDTITVPTAPYTLQVNTTVSPDALDADVTILDPTIKTQNNITVSPDAVDTDVTLLDPSVSSRYTNMTLFDEYYLYANKRWEVVPSGIATYNLSDPVLQNAPVIVTSSGCETTTSSDPWGKVDGSGKWQKKGYGYFTVTPAGVYDVMYNEFSLSPSSNGTIHFNQVLNQSVIVEYESSPSGSYNVDNINVNPVMRETDGGFLQITDVGAAAHLSLKATQSIVKVDGYHRSNLIATLYDSNLNRLEDQKIIFEMMFYFNGGVGPYPDTGSLLYGKLNGGTYKVHPSGFVSETYATTDKFGQASSVFISDAKQAGWAVVKAYYEPASGVFDTAEIICYKWTRAPFILNYSMLDSLDYLSDTAWSIPGIPGADPTI